MRPKRSGSCAACSESEADGMEAVLQMFEVELEGAERLEFARREVLGHFGIGLKLLQEIGIIAAGVLHVPSFHRIALDQIVCLFTAQALPDQGQQDRL